MTTDDGLYPEIEPYRTHRLAVEPPHELHVEECGNPDGVPALFLHGGPGGGVKPGQRRGFDPRAFRIVLFDQRGAGRSTPSAELAGNTTEALIADIERVRVHLGIERWLVTGGSWGSCLALAYGTAHPARCTGFRLHGIFLASPEEVRSWFHGIRRLFPDRWETFAGLVPEAERDDLLRAYHRRLVDPDPAVHLPAAQALRTFSAWTQTFLPDPAHVEELAEPTAALALGLIFTHYCVNRAFLPDGHLLRGVARLRHLPCEIVQGRYDVVTPMITAWELRKAWPEARFTVVDAANHVATTSAPALGRALREATDRLRDRLTAAAGDAPPSIDDYLAQHSATGPAVAPDGGLLAWIDDATGLGQIWGRDLPDGARHRLARTSDKVGFLAFGPKGRDLVFGMDHGGDERQELWLLPDASGQPTRLTDAPGFVHAWGAWSPDGRRIAFGANTRDARHMDVLVMDVASREASRVLEAEGWRRPLCFWPDGSALLIQDARRGGFDTDLVRLDLATGAAETLLPAEGGGRYLSPRWRKDGGGFFLVTNRGREFHGVAFLDIASRGLSWVATPEADVEAMALDAEDARIAYVVNDGGYHRLVVRDLATGGETTVEGLPPGIIASVAFAPDGGGLIVPLTGFTRPSAIWRADPADGSITRLAGGERRGIGERDLVEPSVVAIPSFDDRAVPAFLFEPDGAPPAPGRPAVVVVHGGPEAQYAAHWRADVQYLVRRGWVVLAPNVRGSTGYGRTWQSLDDRRSRMDAVKDLKAVRDWLAALPDVDAGRLVVYGQSYGGFMALAALGEHPDDWKAGAAFYGIANFLTLLETTGPWRRALRAAEYGDPTADKDALERFSPIRKIDRVKAPLFLAHGLEDPRVPPSESEMVAAALRGRGHPHEIVRVAGEGHGFARAENRLRVYRALARFLERHV